MPAAEAPIDDKSRAEAFHHPDDSDNDLCGYIGATGMDGQQSMSSEVPERRIWKGFRRFLVFLCLLRISSFLLLLDFCPGQVASARVFITCQWR